MRGGKSSLIFLPILCPSTANVAHSIEYFWVGRLPWVVEGKESNERLSFTLGTQQDSGLSHLTLFLILSVNFWICGVLDVPQGAGTNEGHSSTSPRPRKVFCRRFRVMSTALTQLGR